MKSKLLLIPCLCFILIVVKADAQNAFSKFYFDSLTSTYGYSIVASNDNGSLIAGSADDAAMVMKIDSIGDVLWSKRYVLGIEDAFFCINQTSDSGFIVTGKTTDNTGNTDLLISKLDAFGDTLWNRKYSGLNNEKGFSVKETMDQGFIITGSLDSLSIISKVLILKLDSAGNLEWSKVGLFSGLQDCGFAVVETPDSGFIVTGNFIINGVFLSAAFVMKLDSSGALIWTKKYDSPGVNITAMDILVSGNNLLWYTYKGETIIQGKMDMNGNFSWMHAYDNASSGPGPYLAENVNAKFKLTLDGGSVIAGSNGFFLTDSNGIGRWGHYLELGSIDLHENYDGTFTVLGNGPLHGTRPLSVIYNPQVGIIRIDSSAGNIFCNSPDSIISQPDSVTETNVILILSSQGNVFPVYPTISTAGLLSVSGCVPFVGGINEITKNEFISIYPNPSSSRINFSFAKSAREYNLSIRNILGQEIYSRLLTGEETKNFSMDIDFAPGMYIVVLNDNRSVYSKKLLIE